MSKKVASIIALGFGLAAVSNMGCARYMERVPVNEPTTHRDRAFYCAERAQSDRANAVQNHVASSLMTGVGGLLTLGSATTFIIGTQASDDRTRQDTMAIGTALLAGAALTLLTKEAFGLNRREAEYAAAASNREQAANRLVAANETDNTDRVFDDCVAQYPGFGVRTVPDVQPLPKQEAQLYLPQPSTQFLGNLEEAIKTRSDARTRQIAAEETLRKAKSARDEVKTKGPTCSDPKRCTDAEKASFEKALKDASEAVEVAEAGVKAASNVVKDADVDLADVQMRIAAWQVSKVEAMDVGGPLLETAKLRYEKAKKDWEKAQQSRGEPAPN